MTEGFIDKSHERAFRRGKEGNWLTARGFDGLWNSDGDCACKVDDLYPCGERDNCKPGVLKPCPPDCAEHDWHIGPKPTAEPIPTPPPAEQEQP